MAEAEDIVSRMFVSKMTRVFSLWCEAIAEGEAATFRPLTAMKIEIDIDKHNDASSKLVEEVEKKYPGKVFWLHGDAEDDRDLARKMEEAEEKQPSMLIISKLDDFCAKVSTQPEQVVPQIAELLTGLEGYEDRQVQVLVVCLIGNITDLHKDIRSSALFKKHKK